MFIVPYIFIVTVEYIFSMSEEDDVTTINLYVCEATVKCSASTIEEVNLSVTAKGIASISAGRAITVELLHYVYNPRI